MKVIIAYRTLRTCYRTWNILINQRDMSTSPMKEKLVIIANQIHFYVPLWPSTPSLSLSMAPEGDLEERAYVSLEPDPCWSSEHRCLVSNFWAIDHVLISSCFCQITFEENGTCEDVSRHLYLLHLLLIFEPKGRKVALLVKYTAFFLLLLDSWKVSAPYLKCSKSKMINVAS